MQQKIEQTIKGKGWYIAGGFAIFAVVLLLIILHGHSSTARHPDKVAFCSAYHSAARPKDLATKLTYTTALEKYAPDDIYPAIHKLRTTYEQAQKDPSSYVSLELGVLGSLQEMNAYTSKNCD